MLCVLTFTMSRTVARCTYNTAVFKVTKEIPVKTVGGGLHEIPAPSRAARNHGSLFAPDFCFAHAVPLAARDSRSSIKDFQHVFLIMMENTGFDTLIGNPNTP